LRSGLAKWQHWQIKKMKKYLKIKKMETKFYNVKIGRYTKKGAFMEEFSFIAKTNNYCYEILNFYTDKYTGFAVEVKEIESAPISVEIPKKEDAEELQMVENPIRYIQKSLKIETICNGLGKEFKAELDDAKSTASDLKSKIDKIKSKMRDFVKSKYGEIAEMVEIENFSLSEYYVKFKITLDETVYSEFIKSEKDGND
jgi:hypothetical protein